MRTHSRPLRRLAAGIAATSAALLTAVLPAPPGSAMLPEVEVAEPTNILPNAGFDAADVTGHPVGWSVSGADATVVYRAADKTAGPGSLEVRDPAGAPVTVISRREVAVAGSTYTLTGDGKVAAGTGARVILRFYDFNKTELGSQETRITGSTFAPFTVTATAPAGADLMSVLIAGDTATVGTTHLDNLLLSGAGATYDPRLGAGRELFVDDYRVDSAHDVTRVVHPGTKLEQPVISPDRPWEASAYTYGSAYRIDGKYRLWYTCYNDVPPNYFLCYAESHDGVHWAKPDLGVYSWKGSTANNIVAEGGGTVAYNPTAPADRRYALLTFRTGAVNDTLGYYGFFSPDGLHWTPVQDKPLLLDGDVSNLSWDPVSQRYIASIKKRMFTADTSGYERSAFVATSPDFVTWSRPQLAVMADAADDGGAYAIGGLESQIYGMPVLPYESVYLGMPWVFDLLSFTAGEYKTAADGPITPEIAASRDLLHWERPSRDPVIEPGLKGAWDDGALYTASTLLVDKDTVSMYYAGFNNGHGGAESTNPDRDHHVGRTGLVTWRRDGFVSISNGALPGTGDAGELVTEPIVLEGSELHLNGTVRRGGTLSVEVLDEAGHPIPGLRSKSLHGDRLDATVSFDDRKALGRLAGTPVRLRFTIVNADLYSYWSR
jgi:hypothetical protein